MSRISKYLKNLGCALGFQAASQLVSFFTRRIFVSILTQEYLGLDGTFSNILSILSLAELGIGGAFTYSLYRPLAQEDHRQIRAVMALYRRVYGVVGLVVAVAGCGLTPFLPVLVRDLPGIPHIHLIYLLFVANSALSYFFVYKQSLMIADQRQYIVTTCHYSMNILLRALQALFLCLTQNYFVYLAIQLSSTVAENLILSCRANRLYPYLKTEKAPPLAPHVKKEIVRNTRAMLFHKLGSTVVFGTDNLLISIFVGAVQVGLYSNYLMVVNGVNSVIHQLFHTLTASVGNLGATEDTAHAVAVFRRANFAAGWIYGFATICLTLLLNPFIELWVGSDYLFSQELVVIIAVNFYVGGMRSTVHTFRSAYGLYWHYRYAPVVESLVNAAASAMLAVPFGVAGILVGTVVSTMTVCFWTEPYVVFHFGFHMPVKEFFSSYGVNTLVTLLTCIATAWCCSLMPGTGIPLFLGKLAVCAVGGNLGFLLAYFKKEEFHLLSRLLLSFLQGRRQKHD